MTEKNTKRILSAAAILMLLGGIALAADNYPIAIPGGNRILMRSTEITAATSSSPAIHAPYVQRLSIYPGGATPISASSANVANASAVATLAGVASKTTFICGFTISSGGATGATLVTPTVVGTITGTLNYTYGAVAGATLANPSLPVSMWPCVPASAVNTAIVVTLPALGAGNTNATVNAWGFQL